MAILKQTKINKEHFLENSDYGFDFYEFLLGDLKKADPNRCENVLNPFYNDKNPGLSIYKKDEMWLYRDHGDSSYAGDVFSFAAHHFGLDARKDFWKLLRGMYDVLEIEKVETEIEVDDKIYDAEYLLPGKFRDPSAINKAHDYFKQFGITVDILRKFNVRAIDSYFYVDKDGNIRQWSYKKNEVALVYEDINHIKLYRPGKKDFKFQYRGSKPPDFIFGQKQIIRDMMRTDKWQRDILIMTGGEKDVMTLTSLGYNAICLNSETATTVPEQLEESILLNYKNIVVLYDNDDTGKKCADTLQRKYGFKTCELPQELAQSGGKDVSDYVKLKLDLTKLHDAIKTASEKRVLLMGKCKGKSGICIKLTQGFRSNDGELINQPEGGIVSHEECVDIKDVSTDTAIFEDKLTEFTNELPLSVPNNRDKTFNAESQLEFQLKQAKIDLSIGIDRPPVCVEIEGSTGNAVVCTYGNFSAFIGKGKSGKTFAVGLLVSSLVKGKILMDKIRPTLRLEKRLIKIYDTEQGKYHVHKSGKRILQIAEKLNDEHFEIFCLRSYTPSERVSLIEYDIYNSPGLGVVVIDGIRDLIHDINNAEESTFITSKLLKWSEELNIHIIVVIHQNKGDNNARGHLGSEIVNKAETIISVTKDKDEVLFYVEPERCREKEFEPFAFIIGDRGLPVIQKDWEKNIDQPKAKKKVVPETLPDEEHWAVLRKIFNKIENPIYKDLVELLMSEFNAAGVDLAITRAKTFLAYYSNKGWLKTNRVSGAKYPVYQFIQPV